MMKVMKRFILSAIAVLAASSMFAQVHPFRNESLTTDYQRTYSVADFVSKADVIIVVGLEINNKISCFHEFIRY